MPLSERYYDHDMALYASSNIYAREWLTAENLREFRHDTSREAGHLRAEMSSRTWVSSEISGIRRIPSIHLRNV